MSVSNAVKYRNPMPFEDLDVWDYFSPPNSDGVIYRKLSDDTAVQVTNNLNYINVIRNAESWLIDGVFKVVITKMEYKEL